MTTRLHAMIRRAGRGLAFVFAAGLFAHLVILASPTPALATDLDSEDSITFSGELYWVVTSGEGYSINPDNVVTLTCGDGVCTVQWSELHFGTLPASFSADDPHIIASTPQSGSVCAGDFKKAISVDLTASPDRLTGRVESFEMSESCEPDSLERIAGQYAIVDFPRVAGNPCLLDENYEGCAAKTPEPIATEAAGVAPVAEDTPGTPIEPILIIGGIAVAVIAGSALAVRAAIKGRGAPRSSVESDAAAKPSSNTAPPEYQIVESESTHAANPIAPMLD